MRFYTFTAVFTPEPKEPDVYNVTVPALPEALTFGDSKEDARFMAQDVLELVVLSRLEEGEPVPSDKKPTKIAKGAFIEEIIVTVDHHVHAQPASYVKQALAHTA
jgi:predicted RNase H-like HicB family nuclease